MKLYIVQRSDETQWNDCDEQAILAENENQALELANKEEGIWYISEIVDINKSRILTKSYNPYY